MVLSEASMRRFYIAAALTLLCVRSAPCVSRFERASELQGLLGSAAQAGSAVASIGDLDGDGIDEIAVGSPGDDHGSLLSMHGAGAVHILFYDGEGHLMNVTRIVASDPIKEEGFGSSLVALGGSEGDKILAVGAPGKDRVHVLFLDREGFVRETRIVSGKSTPGLEGVEVGDALGSSLAAADVDGDKVADLLVVGAKKTDLSNSNPLSQQRRVGCVYLCRMLNTGGKADVTECSKISMDDELHSRDEFGSSVAIIPSGSLLTVVVGATGDDADGNSSEAGAVYVVTLDANHTVQETSKLEAAAFGLGAGGRFGSALAYSPATGTLAVGAETALSRSTGAVLLLQAPFDNNWARLDGGLASANSPEGRFGSSLAYTKKQDHFHLLVGARQDAYSSEVTTGAVWRLGLSSSSHHRNGTVKEETDDELCLPDSTTTDGEEYDPILIDGSQEIPSLSGRLIARLGSIMLLILITVCCACSRPSRHPLRDMTRLPPADPSNGNETSCGIEDFDDHGDDDDNHAVEMTITRSKLRPNSKQQEEEDEALFGKYNGAS